MSNNNNIFEPESDFTSLSDNEYLSKKKTETTSRSTKSKRTKFDKQSLNEKKKTSWYIELDKEQFTQQISDHLGILFLENEQMEDKDQQAFMVREDLWNYPNSLLYTATVITTIGK